jgi:hypothetical protein
VLSLFWATSLHAGALGRGRAESPAANLDFRLSVTVYSKQSLSLAGQNVVSTRIASPESAYHYRCTGPRLLIRSEDKYFLLSEGWTRQEGAAIVLRDTTDMRVEFGPGC